MSDKVREVADRIARELTDQGLLIAAGWQVYRAMALQDVRQVSEIDRYRETFEAGAAHLFTAIMHILEAGTEETEADLRRMDSIWSEIKPIEDRMRLRYGRPAGTG